MWYCVFNVTIQPHHICFYYRPKKGIWGGDFDKSCWRTLHRAEKRDRIIRTWPNHHTYMGVDIIDVILCVRTYPYNPITYVSITDPETWDFGGDFDKSCWRTLHRAEKRDRVIRTWSNHHKYMGVDIIDVILCVRRNHTTPSHMFLLPDPRTWDLGGDFDKSCWRTLHRAEKRDRVIRTWSNHHKYMGVDIIDVILCVRRNHTTPSHMFLLPTQEGDLGGDFDKSCWRTLHRAEKRDRVIRTWSNHHKYMGVDIIDVILCVRRIRYNPITYVSITDPRRGFRGGFWQIVLTDVAQSWEAW